jgi:hypothetical protein
VVKELADEAGLPDTGLAPDDDGRGHAVPAALEGRVEAGELVSPPDEPAAGD